MRRFPVALALAAALSISIIGCSPAPPADESEPADASEAISQEEIEARRARIREHYAERASRYDVVATTVTESGQTIDWIRPETQTLDGTVAKPPAEPPALKQPDEKIDGYDESEPPTGKEPADETARTEVQLQPGARGPEGTVPVVRFDVEGYLKSVEIPPRDPRDILKKLPPPQPAGNNRYYGVWQRFGTFYGTAGRINIWDTTGPVGNETSIAQTAVIRGTPMQAIEAGKIELQGLNGNRRPHLFVYYRTGGAASGDWLGGYNQLVDGWIQVSGSVAPGMSLAAWESVENGNQYSLQLEVRIHQGNWWVGAAGEWAGYYPYCSGGDSRPCDNGTLFSDAGILETASRLDWFGEVFDSSAPAATSTDMGSGDFAADGWQHAAYFRNLTFFWAPTTYWWWNSGTPFATDSSCYSVQGPLYSSQAPWRNWYYYGGPGKEASGCS